jgi:hypothetical protein
MRAFFVVDARCRALGAFPLLYVTFSLSGKGFERVDVEDFIAESENSIKYQPR